MLKLAVSVFYLLELCEDYHLLRLKTIPTLQLEHKFSWHALANMHLDYIYNKTNRLLVFQNRNLPVHSQCLREHSYKQLVLQNNINPQLLCNQMGFILP